MVVLLTLVDTLSTGVVDTAVAVTVAVVVAAADEGRGEVGGCG